MKAKLFLFTISIFGLIANFGCSYSWQNRANTWAIEEVEKVYIQTFTNNSLHPGAEVVFTSAVLKEFSRGGRLKLVSDPDEADAFVQGTVDVVNTTISGMTTVPQIAEPGDPMADAFKDYLIATEYVATVNITVNLTRKEDKALLWTQSFSQARLYPANNRLGSVGNTSMLINDSQKQMALNEIAKNLANDAYDTMLEAF